MGEDMVHESKDSKRDHSSKEILRSGLSGGVKSYSGINSERRANALEG